MSATGDRAPAVGDQAKTLLGHVAGFGSHRTIALGLRSSLVEAQIDDQLLPRTAYDDLLTRHGFTDLGSVELTPTHALTWGRRAE